MVMRACKWTDANWINCIACGGPVIVQWTGDNSLRIDFRRCALEIPNNGTLLFKSFDSPSCWTFSDLDALLIDFNPSTNVIELSFEGEVQCRGSQEMKCFDIYAHASSIVEHKRSLNVTWIKPARLLLFSMLFLVIWLVGFILGFARRE